MLQKPSLKKKKKKDLIFLILQIHFLVFCLIAVLWGRQKLKKSGLTPVNSTVKERKATFIIPNNKTPAKKEDDSPQKPVHLE